MRYLVLSDIHANIDAFDTVLEHAQGRWDRAIVLGDRCRAISRGPASLIGRNRRTDRVRLGSLR